MVTKYAFISLIIAQHLSSTSLGQDPAKVKSNTSFEVGLDGMLGVSVGSQFYSMNVGGPSLFLNISRNLKIGIGALPSLYLLENKLGARLGVAPRIDYKNVVLFAPFFHRDKTETWIWSVGIGYKFHKKK